MDIIKGFQGCREGEEVRDFPPPHPVGSCGLHLRSLLLSRRPSLYSSSQVPVTTLLPEVHYYSGFSTLCSMLVNHPLIKLSSDSPNLSVSPVS